MTLLHVWCHCWDCNLLRRVLMFLCKAVVCNHPSACTASCGWQFLLQKIQFILQGNWGATLVHLLSRGLWNCSNNRTSLVQLLSYSVPQGPRKCSTHQSHCCNFSCLALVIKHCDIYHGVSALVLLEPCGHGKSSAFMECTLIVK
jgi:hypothetical protein